MSCTPVCAADQKLRSLMLDSGIRSQVSIADSPCFIDQELGFGQNPYRSRLGVWQCFSAVLFVTSFDIFPREFSPAVRARSTIPRNWLIRLDGVQRGLAAEFVAKKESLELI